MAEQEQGTRFQLSVSGISLELNGEKAFVEEMYREIMGALQEARERNARGEVSMFSGVTTPVAGTPAISSGSKREASQGQSAPVAEHIIWVHRCTPLVNKIYMATPPELEKVKAFTPFDFDVMTTFYVEDGLLSQVMPQFDRGQTLWAELTKAGRRKIAQASEGTKNASPPPLPGKKGSPTPRLSSAQAQSVKAAATPPQTSRDARRGRVTPSQRTAVKGTSGTREK